jgi:hypothetical protein
LAVVATLIGVGFGPLSRSGSGADASDPHAEQTPTAVKPIEPLKDEALLEEAEPAPLLVDVHVATLPAGAAILLDDGSEACAATPCTVQTAPGSTLVLRAKLGKRRGRTAITPTQEATVLIDLEAPKKRPAKPRNAKASEPKRKERARVSDLKVPEWAQ